MNYQIWSKWRSLECFETLKTISKYRDVILFYKKCGKPIEASNIFQVINEYSDLAPYRVLCIVYDAINCNMCLRDYLFIWYLLFIWLRWFVDILLFLSTFNEILTTTISQFHLGKKKWDSPIRRCKKYVLLSHTMNRVCKQMPCMT